jgi:hypothetical protein
MHKIKWNVLVNNLVLVKLGQEMGTDCRLTRAIHDIGEMILIFLNGVFN